MNQARKFTVCFFNTKNEAKIKNITISGLKKTAHVSNVKPTPFFRMIDLIASPNNNRVPGISINPTLDWNNKQQYKTIKKQVFHAENSCLFDILIIWIKTIPPATQNAAFITDSIFMLKGKDLRIVRKIVHPDDVLAIIRSP
jgi:hypothetical protein